MNIGSKKVPISRKRLNEVLKCENSTQKECAKRINIAYDSLKGDLYRGKTSKENLRAIAKFYDVHPSYLQGTYSKKIEDAVPTFNYSIRELMDKYGYSEYSQAIHLLDINKTCFRVDSEGLYIPPYRDYEIDVMTDMNEQDFKNWILSINLFPEIEVIKDFPSNDYLNFILSHIDRNKLREIQASLIHQVYALLIKNIMNERNNDGYVN